MANPCNNLVTITGDARQIEALRKRINDQDPTLTREDLCSHLDSSKEWGYGLDNDLPLPEAFNLSLHITSKWCPPWEEFERLSKEYPLLTIEVVYEEHSMRLFGKAIIEGGKQVLDERISELDYYTEYDKEFSDELKVIKELDYETFKNEYILNQEYRGSYTWLSKGHLLEPILLKRVKDNDLPLLIDALEYCGDKLRARLSKTE